MYFVVRHWDGFGYDFEGTSYESTPFSSEWPGSDKDGNQADWRLAGQSR